MPAWLIPILMAALGGAAGQAEGHNTKSTLEGAGLGALLGVGGGAAGLLGSGSEASAAAGGATDATIDPALMGSDALGNAAASGTAGFDTAGASGLDLGSLSSATASGGDTADLSMMGSGASQGVDPANMGAIMGQGQTFTPASGVGDTTGMTATNSVAPTGSGAYWTPSGSATSGSQPSSLQSFVNSPQYQKFFGKADDMATQAAIRAALTPQTRTSIPGQPILGAPPPGLQSQPLQMPSYAQQMQQLGF